jgi:hypothetical protein
LEYLFELVKQGLLRGVSAERFYYDLPVLGNQRNYGPVKRFGGLIDSRE